MTNVILVALANASGCASAPPAAAIHESPTPVSHKTETPAAASQPATAPAEAVAPTTRTVPTVNFIHPVPADSKHDLQLPADLKASRFEAIYPHIDGYLKKWYFDIGQRVRKGDVLADIESMPVVDPLDQQVKDARADVESARSELSLERVTLKRFEQAKAQDPGSVASKEIDNHKAGVEEAQTHFNDARSKLASAETRAAAATNKPNAEAAAPASEKLTAAFDGIVTGRNYDTGAVLSDIREVPGKITTHSPGTELFDVSQIEPLSGYVRLPAEYQNSVKTGQQAELVISSQAQPFMGVVKHLDDTPDAATRTLRARIDFPNNDQRLFPGQFGTVHLTVTDAQPPLMIPASALIFQTSASGLFVAVIEDGEKIALHSIKVGRDLGVDMEVTSGLSRTDKVVSNPSDAISSGTVVIENPVAYDGKTR